MKPTLVLKKYFPPPATVLDVGARDGATSKILKEVGYDVTSIDIESNSPDVIEIPIEEYVGVHDIVVARLLVHLLKKDTLGEKLDLLASHVKPGGFLYFTNFGEEDPWFKESADAWLSDKEVLHKELHEFESMTYAGDMKKWSVWEYFVAVK